MRPPIEPMLTIRPCAGADRVEQGLGDGQQPEDVDLVLAAHEVERDALQRPGDRDAGVVDEPGQRGAADARGQAGDLAGVGHVDEHRLDARVLRAQVGAVLLAAHAGEDGEAGAGQPQGGRAPDAGRRAGDDHGSRAGHGGEP